MWSSLKVFLIIKIKIFHLIYFLDFKIKNLTLILLFVFKIYKNKNCLVITILLLVFSHNNVVKIKSTKFCINTSKKEENDGEDFETSLVFFFCYKCIYKNLFVYIALILNLGIMTYRYYVFFVCDN